MKKFTVTFIFGIIGVIAWCLTLFLRDSSLVSNEALSFILGVMPNIGAAWLFIWFTEVIMINKLNMNFTIKYSSMVSGVIFIFALISEVVHDLFLDSPFDMNDMIATFGAIALYLVIFYFSNKYKENTTIASNNN